MKGSNSPSTSPLNNSLNMSNFSKSNKNSFIKNSAKRLSRKKTAKSITNNYKLDKNRDSIKYSNITANITSWKKSIGQKLINKSINDNIQQYRNCYMNFNNGGEIFGGIAIGDKIKNAKDLTENLFVSKTFRNLKKEIKNHRRRTSAILIPNDIKNTSKPPNKQKFHSKKENDDYLLKNEDKKIQNSILKFISSKKINDVLNEKSQNKMENKKNFNAKNLFKENNDINSTKNSFSNYSNLTSSKKPLKSTSITIIPKKINKEDGKKEKSEENKEKEKKMKENKNSKLYRRLGKKGLVYDSFDDEEDIFEFNYGNDCYLSPDSVPIKILDILVFLFSSISVIIIPIWVSNDINYCPQTNTFKFFFYIFIDVLYMIDFIAGFFRAYYNFEDKLIINKGKIFNYYLASSFIIDLICAFPFNFLVIFNCHLFYEKKHIFDYNREKLIFILHFLKILKMIKIKNVQYNVLMHSIDKFLEESLFIEKFGEPIFFFLLICSILHIGGCINVFLSNTNYPSWKDKVNSNFNNNLLNKGFIHEYIAGIYFLIATLTTVGYGDITVVSIYEHAFQIFILLVGILGYSYMLTKISNSIRNKGKLEENFREKVAILDDLKLRHEEITSELYDKIYKFLEYSSLHEKQDRTTLINFLPPTIKNALLSEMYSPIIKHFKIFKYFKNIEFVNRIISKFLPVLTYKNDILFLKNEPIEEIILVREGRLNIEVVLSEKKEEKLEDINEYFEELSSLLEVNKNEVDENIKEINNSMIGKVDNEKEMESKDDRGMNNNNFRNIENSFHKKAKNENPMYDISPQVRRGENNKSNLNQNKKISFKGTIIYPFRNKKSIANKTTTLMTLKTLQSLLLSNTKKSKMKYNEEEEESKQKDEEKYIYLKILDIRKNEHFGDLFMLLNKASPFNLKVKSKRAELYVLKKIDTIKISADFPNVWQRSNRKSFHNMKQLYKLALKAIKKYCIFNNINIEQCPNRKIISMQSLPTIYESYIHEKDSTKSIIEEQENFYNKYDNIRKKFMTFKPHTKTNKDFKKYNSIKYVNNRLPSAKKNFIRSNTNIPKVKVEKDDIKEKPNEIKSYIKTKVNNLKNEFIFNEGISSRFQSRFSKTFSEINIKDSILNEINSSESNKSSNITKEKKTGTFISKSKNIYFNKDNNESTNLNKKMNSNLNLNKISLNQYNSKPNNNQKNFFDVYKKDLKKQYILKYNTPFSPNEINDEFYEKKDIPYVDNLENLVYFNLVNVSSNLILNQNEFQSYGNKSNKNMLKEKISNEILYKLIFDENNNSLLTARISSQGLGKIGMEYISNGNKGKILKNISNKESEISYGKKIENNNNENEKEINFPINNQSNYENNLSFNSESNPLSIIYNLNNNKSNYFSESEIPSKIKEKLGESTLNIEDIKENNELHYSKRSTSFDKFNCMDNRQINNQINTYVYNFIKKDSILKYQKKSSNKYKDLSLSICSESTLELSSCYENLNSLSEGEISKNSEMQEKVINTVLQFKKQNNNSSIWNSEINNDFEKISEKHNEKSNEKKWVGRRSIFTLSVVSSNNSKNSEISEKSKISKKKNKQINKKISMKMLNDVNKNIYSTKQKLDNPNLFFNNLFTNYVGGGNKGSGLSSDFKHNSDAHENSLNKKGKKTFNKKSIRTMKTLNKSKYHNNLRKFLFDSKKKNDGSFSDELSDGSNRIYTPTNKRIKFMV